ncbi:MAG: hypothetical protein VX228_13940, partial [Pseudomonadota bacterium]|nr:hypothetical protein [Pseudomonadota bacterium]
AEALRRDCLRARGFLLLGHRYGPCEIITSVPLANGVPMGKVRLLLATKTSHKHQNAALDQKRGLHIFKPKLG